VSSVTETTRVVNLRDPILLLKDKIGKLSVPNNINKQIIRVSVKLESDISLLGWLKSTMSQSKIYWTDRSDKIRIAGVGECLLFEADDYEKVNNTIQSAIGVLRHSDDGLCIYGGIRFPTLGVNGHSSDWQEFKACRFLIPRFEIVSSHGQFELVCNMRKDELHDTLKLNDEINSFLTIADFDSTEHSEIVNRQDEPTFDGWSGNIKSIIKDFSNGKVEKIVLARQTSVHFKESCDALALLDRLNNSTPHCYHYLFQPKNGVAFMGASPEQLYARRGKQIASEALAGTRPRGENSEQDLKLGEELLHNDKEFREHNFVVENIKSTFNEICERYSINNGTELLKLNRVQHLQTKFNGSLKNNISDAAIINLLHPTSAVGGFPSESARERIAQCEQFDRGWYAGAVGWLSKDSAEFAVAIRSGLVRENQLKLFSGAGIVRGSTPESEWAEIESKIGSFLSAVTG
jgi:menaquinone-specific isochorismate synthase